MNCKEKLNKADADCKKANADYSKAKAGMDKACDDRNKANADWDKACDDRSKAYADFNKANADYSKAGADCKKAKADYSKAKADYSKAYADYSKVRARAQAQRGHDKYLAARIQERIANRRKDRNHKLSRRLVSENVVIKFSADNHKAVARRFGKSVASSGHSQLQRMLSYKSPQSGTEYFEIAPKDSTKTCWVCGDLTGPTGLAGLSVREWRCIRCGTFHDRDVNSSFVTLITPAAGCAVEVCI